MTYTVHNLGIANQRLQTNLGIARGDYKDLSYINKFGRNPSIGNAPETVWNTGGIYTYLSEASTVYAYSADADDAAAGAGARTIEIQGLDSNYNVITDTVTVGGAVSTNSFLRIFRCRVATAGATGVNEGNIIISTGAGGTGTTLCTIGTVGTGTVYGVGQSFLGLYTVPAHCRGYLTSWSVGVGAYNDTCLALIKNSTGATNVYNTSDIMECSGGQWTRYYDVPIVFAERTDIEIRAICSTGTSISSSFTIILERLP